MNAAGRGLLVLLRHGQSEWNHSHRFTGWADPRLTARGAREAGQAGLALAAAGMGPDVIVTSLLGRATETVERVVAAAGWPGVSVRATWRLNERHYGSLEGLSHAQAERWYGVEPVHRWRRTWAAVPPQLAPEDARHPSHDPRYAAVPAGELPAGESLAGALARQLPVLAVELDPLVGAGARVLLVGHGNSLRALVAHLERMPPARVPGLLVPTGVPLVYGRDGEGWVARPVEFGLTGSQTGP